MILEYLGKSVTTERTVLVGACTLTRAAPTCTSVFSIFTS